MRTEIENVREIAALLSDEGFVRAITNAEPLVDDAELVVEDAEALITEVDGTLERIERIENEANEALHAVDQRLLAFDRTLSKIEAKIEAGFTLVFFGIAFSRYAEGDLLGAAILALLGLMGIGSLAVTIWTLPHVQKLRQVGEFATDTVEDAVSQDRDR